tara:strand:- start:1738 stop:2364 length:627 start_codon:yes stop_codon:yes gene_type:complete
MNRGIYITVAACLGFMALILALFLSRFYTPRELTVDEYKTLGAYLIDPPRQLAEFNLVDDKGEIFLPEQFNNKWNILFFGFTYCPDICPLTMKQMSDVKEMLGEDAQKIRVFLVSVDPDRDKPENLRVYLDNFSNNFRGLTGEIDQIYKFSTQVNAPFFPVVNNPEPNYTVDHSGSLVLIDPDAKYAGFFRAPHDTSKITKALASILN